MDLTKEIIENNNLTDDQVSAINAHIVTGDADIKKEFDGKANQDAQNILSGAATAVTKITGVALGQGQKIAEFFESAGATYVENQLTVERKELGDKKLEYEQKIKDGGSGHLQKDLDDVNFKLESLQQKEATFNELIEGDYKTKYDDLVTSNSSLKITNAFTSVKPTFPETVNKFEADARFREWKNSVLEGFTIEFDDNGDPIAIDKNNKFMTKKLSELLDADKNISVLMEGRKQQGTGHQPGGVKKIDNVPFDVPEDKSKRSQAITDYLVTTEKLKTTDPNFGRRFGELNVLIKQGTA